MRNSKVLTLIMSLGLLFIGLVPLAQASEENQQMTVTFQEPVQIPGMVLAPGTYTFQLVNPDMDRGDYVVINAKTEKALEIISGVPTYRGETTSTAEFLLTKNEVKGTPELLHGWFYPDRHEGVEFVYPAHK